MATTLTNLRDIFYDVLREEQDSNAYPYTLVDLLLNNTQNRICNGKLVNPFTKEKVRKGQLPFLHKDAYYSNVAPTGLTTAATVGGGTLTVTSTTNFGSTGSLYIAGNIVTYTGTTATTFTGCTNVLFAFASGTEVSQAFDMPTDYMSTINLIYNNRLKLPAKQYDDVYEDLNSYKGTIHRRDREQPPYTSPYRVTPFYSIKDSDYLLIYNFTDTGDQILLRYEKLPTTMTATSDTATIDNDDYTQTTIPLIAVGEMLYHRGEEGRAKELLNFAYGQAEEMYDFYNKQNYEKQSGVQYKTAKSKLNI